MFAYTLIAFVLGWIILKQLKKNFNVFNERGIKFEEPVIIFGSMWKLASGKVNTLDYMQTLYNKFYGEKIFGLFQFSKPNFVVTDPEIIKQITIKDFDSFVNHDKILDESVDKLFGKSLFQMFDEKWRNMRNSLSPIFTSAKMKMMFGILSECAQEFIEDFDKKSNNDKIIVDVKDKFSRYTVNGISTAALGIQGDCIKNQDSYVYKLANDTTKPTFFTTLRFTLAFMCKPLYKFLKFQLISEEFYKFFEKTIVDVMDERDRNGTFRPDVVQLLLQMKKGQLDKNEKSDDKDLANFSANIEYDVGSKNSNIKFDKEDFMAQGFIFFGAGFDTTQRLLQFTAYELAMNRDVQDELIAEVDDVLSQMNGKPVTYEALHKMKFLDQVISEVLRFHPPLPFTTRECNKDYTLKLGKGQTVEIKNGDNILIPVRSIHRDEKLYENAGKFDPHRFDDSRKDSIIPGSYLPFGYGPRVCIGSRFALMEAKLLIFYILSKYTIESCNKTPRKIEFIPSLFSFDLTQKIFVEFKARN